MSGKISEYIETAINKATDLLDKTVLEGGVLVTRSVTALNFFKPRTKTLPFASPQIVIDFGFETTATVNITGDTTIFIGTYDNGGVYQLILYPDATPRTVTLGSSFGDNLESSPMQFVTYPNRPYVIKVYVSHNGQVSNSIDRWQSAPDDILAGTNEIVCKTQFGYYTRTLTAISSWIKSAIYASDVINNSLNVTGTTVKDVFDNADCVAVTSMQDADMIPFSRVSGAVSENKMIPAIDAKSYFADAFSSAVFVCNGTELSTALAAEKETMQICATAGITSGSISNVYAGNLWITGRKLIFDSGLILPNSSSSRAVTRMFFDASVTMFGDVGEGAVVFAVTTGTWYFTFRNLSQDMPIKFVAAGTSEIHVVCGNTITVDPASTGTYTVTQDSTLDLGQDDVRLDGSNVFNVGAGISANTEVLIKANTGFVTLATLGELTGISTGVAGVWSFIYDNGDVLVDGDASKSGRFGIKVAFKFKHRDTPFTCNLFPNASIGTWVRFEHADWCINADNTGGGGTYADLNQSFTVKGFFDAVSDLIQSGNYSNIAGAGTVSENQQDDGFRYLQSVQRIQRNACTFTIGTSIQASTKEVWLLIHLSGTIL